MPDDKRTGTLVAFVKAFEINALDDALDVLDLLITDRSVGKTGRPRAGSVPGMCGNGSVVKCLSLWPVIPTVAA